jgi:hypothetical protein
MKITVYLPKCDNGFTSLEYTLSVLQCFGLLGFVVACTFVNGYPFARIRNDISQMTILNTHCHKYLKYPINAGFMKSHLLDKVKWDILK